MNITAKQTTYLQNIEQVSDEDFGFEDPADYNKLMHSQLFCTPVTIDCIAVSSGNYEHNYYDITLADGTVVGAISGTHLANIQQIGPLIR